MLNILLIEDEFIITKDLETQLSKNNYANIDSAKNYKNAIRLFTENDYDIIIADINLNDEKDGIEIISELAKFKIVPVVYLTAYSDSEIIKRAQKTLPFAYILKPYNNQQLKATIDLAILNSKKDSIFLEETLNENPKLDLLTKREKEILVVLATGKMSREIAEILTISVGTVEQHKKNIKKKLDLNTVGELVNFTMTTKLLKI
ncbi:response regulator [Gramella sp. AN32]|uniref:Response regulator n=1 Tax=Christiangramia antarctica TaxID=2058158 RepID=A0ABW5X707_9FLAO|nr:response regulator [Gramella sp. AN32]MCM4157467.1 DNA-binding response regulator [Gramella sp. AN32]